MEKRNNKNVEEEEYILLPPPERTTHRLKGCPERSEWKVASEL